MKIKFQGKTLDLNPEDIGILRLKKGSRCTIHNEPIENEQKLRMHAKWDHWTDLSRIWSVTP